MPTTRTMLRFECRISFSQCWLVKHMALTMSVLCAQPRFTPHPNWVAPVVPVDVSSVAVHNRARASVVVFTTIALQICEATTKPALCTQPPVSHLSAPPAAKESPTPA
jgi:isoprenylcysteine carboxyl methyltransferase (ICMT) family protein YpbQ